jgi:hypothetical protein
MQVTRIYYQKLDVYASSDHASRHLPRPQRLHGVVAVHVREFRAGVAGINRGFATGPERRHGVAEHQDLELGGSADGTEPNNGSSGHPIPEQDGCGPTGVDGLATPVGAGHEAAFRGGHGHRVRRHAIGLKEAK